MNRIAAAIIRRGDQILLVKQQGDHDPEPSWALPGGVVESDESLVEGLVREVREETGLTITDVRSLEWFTEMRTQDDDFVYAFIYDVDVSEFNVMANDPDDYILEVRFVQISTAVDFISQTLPWQSMREPLLAYLKGVATTGTTWSFADQGSGSETLESVAPLLKDETDGR